MYTRPKKSMVRSGTLPFSSVLILVTPPTHGAPLKGPQPKPGAPCRRVSRLRKIDLDGVSAAFLAAAEDHQLLSAHCPEAETRK